jgi:hypothetical protein
VCALQLATSPITAYNTNVSSKTGATLQLTSYPQHSTSPQCSTSEQALSKLSEHESEGEDLSPTNAISYFIDLLDINLQSPEEDDIPVEDTGEDKTDLSEQFKHHNQVGTENKNPGPNGPGTEG